MSRTVPTGSRQNWPEDRGPEPWYQGRQGYGPRGVGPQSYGPQGYDRQGYDTRDAGRQGYRQGQDAGRQGYRQGQDAGRQGYRQGQDAGRQGYRQGQGDGRQGRDGGGEGPHDRRHGPPRRFRRLRRLTQLRSVRAIGVLILVFFVWVAFSVGQALAAPGSGSTSSRLAEWARGHYLGPVVTLGEWLTYNPPKVGGKPSFSLAVPKGQGITSHKPKGATANTFQPDIPATLKSLARSPLSGEGQWRVLEKVNGQPAVFGTFLRDATYTSYVNGVVSMDQRLVKFQLHPGSQDPGPGNWGPNSQPWIPPGSRTGLLATFNGGFKLDSAQGGFYLNGSYKGSLRSGAASVVYYKNGTIKIGEWGRDVGMTSQVVGVRQNLKLIVDHGQVPNSVNSNVESNWGATLGVGRQVQRRQDRQADLARAAEQQDPHRQLPT
jgi:hypothetical protein